MFASIPVFDEMDFKKKSGWYKPTVADVSCCIKLTNVHAFTSLKSWELTRNGMLIVCGYIMSLPPLSVCLFELPFPHLAAGHQKEAGCGCCCAC